MASNKNVENKEPLIRITKRDAMPVGKAILVRAIAILLAVLLSAVIIVILTKYDPVKVFKAMFEGNFATSRKFVNMLESMAILLCISLAVTPAFRMRFWNTGAEGQVLMGALSSFVCMKFFANLPNGVLIPVMFLAGIVGGIIWAVIPAIFKATWNTNETLFTLMMNYVAMQIIMYCVAKWSPGGSGVIGVQNMWDKKGWMPEVGGQEYIINIIFVAVATVIIYFYLNYTKHGYEISVVGESENTARYIGINVKKVIIRTMALSGALCGLAGFLLVSGASHTINKDLAGGMGFTAIMVSWLAKFNPVTMVAATFLIVFLQKGSSQIAVSCKLNESIADIITGIILFFIIGCEFFVNYKVNLRHKNKEAK